MAAKHPYRVTTFGDAKVGELLIATIASKHVAFGMKACFASDETAAPQIVILGPFPEGGGQPVRYEGSAVRPEIVLNVSDTHRLTPSLLPKDILAEPPLSADKIGTMLLGVDKALLCIDMQSSSGGPRVGFLNVATGQLENPPQHSNFITSSSWCISRDEGPTKPTKVFEFP